ncbi:MAG: hypothetical protein KKF26_03635 [Chloroflexi bacterium]|nr:hypothetical protein [Chloroflexota bacterium]
MVVEVKSPLSDRVRGLRENLFSRSPQLSTQRLRFLKETYQETEGLPAVLRRAKLLEKVLKGMTIFIDDNPIVGTLTEHRLGVTPYPEVSCKWMKSETEFSSSLGKVLTTEEDRQLLGELADYWEDKCILARTKEIWNEKYSGKLDRDECVERGVWLDQTSVPRGRLSVDYAKVMNIGLEGIIAEAEAELKNLPMSNREALNKRYFLDAVIIANKAVIAFARRYADLARKMAATEPDAARKKELESIAEVCSQVPAKPARSFHEAIQSFWFTHLGCLHERNGSGYGPGRFALYTFPFYRRDKEAGRIDEEGALELLELLFIKLTEVGAQFEFQKRFQQAMGNKFQNLSIGGLTPDGRDATNDLDFLLLEAQKRVRMIQPTLSLLYHSKIPEALLLKAAEVVRTGIGMPAFFNNELNIERLLAHGTSLEDARNSCIIGCVELGVSHACNTMWGGPINMAKPLELALNNGLDPLSGKQFGPKTGKAESFQSYEELHEAVIKQFEYFAGPFFDFQFTSNAIEAEVTPLPFASSLVDDCIKNGKEMGEGGARYSMDGCNAVGVIDLANSLAAVKKLVFEDKRITMKELLEALNVDFQGHEEIHQWLLNAPKYGNDVEYADNIAREWYDIFWQKHEEMAGECHLGRHTKPTAFSVVRHFPFGAAMGAMPSGRKAGLPLTDGSVSAMPGTDTNGPTALINSASRAVDTSRYAATLLNMKFHPTALKNTSGLRNLTALTKTYAEMGGHHIQFNVVSAETLKDAQLHPENHRDLIVRVAGFSAFFIQLDPVVQEEIIKRTELSFE